MLGCLPPSPATYTQTHNTHNNDSVQYKFINTYNGLVGSELAMGDRSTLPLPSSNVQEHGPSWLHVADIVFRTNNNTNRVSITG